GLLGGGGLAWARGGRRRGRAPPPLSAATDGRSSSSILPAPQLRQPRVAPAIVAVELVADRILQVIVLVIVLRLVERAGGHDLRRHRLLEARLDPCLRRFRQSALLVVVVEARGAVLVAVVAELAVLRQRIDVVPEHVEELLEAHVRRVVGDLDRFGVAGAAVRHLLVARVGDVAAGIARGSAHDAGDLVEIGLHTPEAAAREGRDLRRLLSGRAGGKREPKRQTKPDTPHDDLPVLPRSRGPNHTADRTTRLLQFASRSCDHGVTGSVVPAGRPARRIMWEGPRPSGRARRRGRARSAGGI